MHRSLHSSTWNTSWPTFLPTNVPTNSSHRSANDGRPKSKLSAKTLYKNYQNEAVFLSEAQKTERENAIVAKEKEASELKKKYFGPEGELYKKRIALLEPIQDEVYNAVKGIATSKGFQLILDRASEGAGIIFASPNIDISNDVLAKLGYSR